MKRINPNTNKPFKRGDLREDGKVFLQFYLTKPLTKDGFYAEFWCSPELYFSKKQKENAWAKKNGQLMRKNVKTYRKNNVPKILAYNAKRRADKLKATPKWLTESQKQQIQDFYSMAKALETIFPWKQHVDHVVPLAGINVSGLHVPWNLQILSDSNNRSKTNKYGV